MADDFTPDQLLPGKLDMRFRTVQVAPYAPGNESGFEVDDYMKYAVPRDNDGNIIAEAMTKGMVDFVHVRPYIEQPRNRRLYILRGDWIVTYGDGSIDAMTPEEICRLFKARASEDGETEAPAEEQGQLALEGDGTEAPAADGTEAPAAEEEPVVVDGDDVGATPAAAVIANDSHEVLTFGPITDAKES